MSENKLMSKNHVNAIMVNAPSIRNWGSSPKIVTMYDRTNNCTFIYSYNTCVAVQIQGVIYVPQWHSRTTTQHINRVAKESPWKCEIVKLY